VFLIYHFIDYWNGLHKQRIREVLRQGTDLPMMINNEVCSRATGWRPLCRRIDSGSCFKIFYKNKPRAFLSLVSLIFNYFLTKAKNAQSTCKIEILLRRYDMFFRASFDFTKFFLNKGRTPKSPETALNMIGELTDYI
jgi:hypothetical protein